MNNKHIYSAYEFYLFDTLQSTQNRALNSVCFYEFYLFFTFRNLTRIIKSNTKDTIK